MTSVTYPMPGSNNHTITEIEAQLRGIMRAVELAYGRHALSGDNERAAILNDIYDLAQDALVRCEEFRLPVPPSLTASAD